MIEVMIEKKDPRMMVQMFLEKVGQMDMTKLEAEKADELKKIIAEVKANMDNPEKVLPLIMKGKMLLEAKPEEPEMEEEEDEEEMPEKEMPEKEYKAMDALNEIKAILAKVKED